MAKGYFFMHEGVVLPIPEDDKRITKDFLDTMVKNKIISGFMLLLETEEETGCQPTQ